MDVRHLIQLSLPGLALLCGVAHGHGVHDVAEATSFAADLKTPYAQVLDSCVSPEDTRRDSLLSGLGGTRYPLVSLKEADKVEAFYSQGMALQYGFNFAEAIRAFYQASRFDEGAAMPYWGIALSANSNINSDATSACNLLGWRSARLAKEKAQQRLSDTGLQERFSVQQRQRELDYAEAILKLYTVKDGKVSIDQEGKKNYVAAMKKLSEQYSDDLDAATLYADALLNLEPWKWWQGTEATSDDVRPVNHAYEAIQVLNRVLVQDQLHTGANHFYIHAIEESPFPASGLPMAERFRIQNPAIGHLVHMASHIYQRTGDNNLASVTNYTAVAVDRAYVNQVKPQSPYPLHYLGHNIHFLTWTLSIEGRQNEAMNMAEELVDNTTRYAAQDFLCQHYPAEIHTKADYFYAVPYYFAVRFQDWDALARIEPKIRQGLKAINETCKAAVPDWQELRLPYTQTMAAYALAYRQLARPELDSEAARETLKVWWQAVRESLKKEPRQPDKELTYGNNKAVELYRIANLILLNRAQRYAGEKLKLPVLDEAIAQVFNADDPQELVEDMRGLAGDNQAQVMAAWRKAVAVQDALNYNEPPDWYYTLRESLGYALLDQHRYAEAERVFRDDLESNRLSGRSLNGLKVSLEKQGKGVPAMLGEQFRNAWRNATVSAAPF